MIDVREMKGDVVAYLRHPVFLLESLRTSTKLQVSCPRPGFQPCTFWMPVTTVSIQLSRLMNLKNKILLYMPLFSLDMFEK